MYVYKLIQTKNIFMQVDGRIVSMSLPVHKTSLRVLLALRYISPQA